MEQQCLHYILIGANYGTGAYDVRQVTVLKSASAKANRSFSIGSHAPEIRYTLDGVESSANAKLYTKPYNLRKPATLKDAF